MADFSETSVSRNAKRVYSAAIADIDSFETIVSAFADDTTMLIEKELSAATYKAKIVYTDAAGDDAGYNTFYATSKTQMETGVTALTAADLVTTIAGEGGSGTVSEDSYHWLVKFSCTKDVTIGSKTYEDTFNVSIGREYMLISGFSYDATLEAVETWADAQTALA